MGKSAGSLAKQACQRPLPHKRKKCLNSLQAALKKRGADKPGIRALIDKLTLREEALANGDQNP